MRGQRLMFVGPRRPPWRAACTFAQPGRGGSQWLTALADAQRTSWIRTDDKISVAALAKPGFALQWKSKLDNQPRGVHGLTQGVTASGVTLFVPMSVVARQLEQRLRHRQRPRLRRVAAAFRRRPRPPRPARAAAASRRRPRASSGPTRFLPTPFGGFGGGRGAVGYRSLLGEPGEGVPVEGRAGGGGRRAIRPAPRRRPARAAPSRASNRARRRRGASAPPAGRGGQAGRAHPRRAARGRRRRRRIRLPVPAVGRRLCRVERRHAARARSAVGQGHAEARAVLPANAQWSAPDRGGHDDVCRDVGKLRRRAERGVGDRSRQRREAGRVVEDQRRRRRRRRRVHAGRHARSRRSAPGKATGDGKANAIVALDAKTLQLKDWFTQPTAEFVTGPDDPSARRQGASSPRRRKTAASLLLDAAVARRRRITPRRSSVSKPCSAPAHDRRRRAGRLAGIGARQAAGAGAPAQPAPPRPPWILVPLRPPRAGVPSGNGAVSAGAVVALKLTGAGGALSLAPGWVSHDLSSPATPLIVNGVVFALATGVPATATGTGRRGGPSRLRRRDRQAAVEERQGDDDARVARQHVERPGADLRRHARRHAPRVRVQRRAARDYGAGDEVADCRGSGLRLRARALRRTSGARSAAFEPQSTMSRCLHYCCCRS